MYQKELHKACFQHDVAYGYFQNLTRRITSGEILHDKALNIAKNLKYDGYHRRLASVFYKFFDESTLKVFLIKN